MSTPNLVDHFGRPIALGPELGKGGEGSVFDITTLPDLVAKVYHNPRTAQEQAKLRAVISLARKELCDIAAWPTATLHDRLGGPVRGVVMRKVKSFKEIHFLYSPAHRKTTFPRADWRFLAHVAMNCAAAFDTMHGRGVVIGDVNQSNIFVSEQGLVALIDCDSYQVQINGQTFPCEVGIDLFTPPELQGRSFRGVVRSSNHDRFGLAVLIFYLLFMNRHPFAGRYLGPGDMPIGQAIQEYRFAYSRSAATYQMQTPLHALPLSAVSTQLVDLFERAFRRGSEQPNARPTAAEWQGALKTLLASMRACSLDHGHVYAPHLPQCPWHALMQQGAPNFFVTVTYFRALASAGGASFDLSAVWARIEHVQRPSMAYVRPTMPGAASPSPWPTGVGQVVPATPIPPAILTAPPQLPATLRATPAVPPKPLPPAILTAPPPPPAIIAAPTRHSKQVISATSAQRAIGIGAGLCASGFIPIGLIGAILGGAVLGSRGASAGLLGIVVFFGFIMLGVWWLVLERQRRQREHELNREYEEEIAQQKAKARRQRKAWEARLAAQQAEARGLYCAEMTNWEHRVAAIHVEARQRREAWEAHLEAEQGEARRKHDLELKRRQNTVAAMRAEAERRRRAVADTWQRAEAAEQNWGSIATRYTAEFDKKIAELRRLYNRHRELVAEYAVERQRMQAGAREMQLEQFLQQKFLIDDKITGIGPARLATLASYGIETAFDIVAVDILQVPGFKEQRTARLVEWRESMEARFVFNAAAGIPPHLQQALDTKHAQARQQVEAALLSGERELKAIATGAENESRQLYEHVKFALRQFFQAHADAQAIPPGL